MKLFKIGILRSLATSKHHNTSMENQQNDKERYQEFYDDAKSISFDILKHLLTLSTGILAVFFLLLADDEKPIVLHEKILLFLAICCFGLAIFFALQAWHLESERSYLIGAALDPAKKSTKETNLVRKRTTEQLLKLLKRGLRVFFLLGVLIALGYLCSRLF